MKDHYDFSDAEQGRFYTKPEDMVISLWNRRVEYIFELYEKYTSGLTAGAGQKRRVKE
jgi:hypothetical protein